MLGFPEKGSGILDAMGFRTAEERGFEPEDIPIQGPETFTHVEVLGRRWTIVFDCDGVARAVAGDWDMSEHGFVFQKNPAVIA